MQWFISNEHCSKRLKCAFFSFLQVFQPSSQIPVWGGTPLWELPSGWLLRYTTTTAHKCSLIPLFFHYISLEQIPVGSSVHNHQRDNTIKLTVEGGMGWEASIIYLLSDHSSVKLHYINPLNQNGCITKWPFHVITLPCRFDLFYSELQLPRTVRTFHALSHLTGFTLVFFSL